MLQFLETGKALYVLGAICGIGFISKMITGSLYKRLIKETDNMVLTKNKNLKALKQKLENAYRVSQVIVNTQAYIEKQMYSFKFMKVSLDGWNNFSTQTALLCLLLGGAGSFLSYWYRIDSYYIVLYGSMGIMAGLFMVFVDNGVNVSMRRQRLSAILQEYVDNSAFTRATRERDVVLTTEQEATRGSVRGLVGRTSSIRDREEVRTALSDTQKMTEPSVKEEVPAESARVSRGSTKRARVSRMEQDKDESRKDIDYLKNSLEQIAVSREKVRVEEDWTKGLKPEEIKVIGDIIREYFGNN